MEYLRLPGTPGRGTVSGSLPVGRFTSCLNRSTPTTRSKRHFNMAMKHGLMKDLQEYVLYLHVYPKTEM